jgi:hypothetical protein
MRKVTLPLETFRTVAHRLPREVRMFPGAPGTVDLWLDAEAERVLMLSVEAAGAASGRGAFEGSAVRVAGR